MQDVWSAQLQNVRFIENQFIIYVYKIDGENKNLILNVQNIGFYIYVYISVYIYYNINKDSFLLCFLKDSKSIKIKHIYLCNI